MSDPGATGSVARRLLLNGEALRIDVEPAPTGGGRKYEPFTSEEAREWLLPQVRSARADIQALPDFLPASDRVYIEAKLLPNYIAPTYYPEALLGYIGAVPVGSRADIGTLRTASKVQQSGTRRLILAVDDAAMERLEALIDAHGVDRSAQQAFAQIRRLEEFAPPAASTVLRSAPERDTIGGAESVWEAVLHPRGVRSGEPVPLDDDAIERWVALLESRGGAVHRDFLRRVGGLTFMPIRAASTEVAELARSNPLRVLRPMPAIRPRPRAMITDALHETSAWLAGADRVWSCVTGDSAFAAAASAAEWMTAGAQFVDLTTASPDDKRAAADLASKAGVGYADVAIMGAVAIAGIAAPLLITGETAGTTAAELNEVGCSARAAIGDAGDAIALKLLRTVLPKGVEAFIAVEKRGVREELCRVLTNINEQGLTTFLNAVARTHLPHAERRMHEVERAITELRQEELSTHVLDGKPVVNLEVSARVALVLGSGGGLGRAIGLESAPEGSVLAVAVVAPCREHEQDHAADFPGARTDGHLRWQRRAVVSEPGAAAAAYGRRRSARWRSRLSSSRTPYSLPCRSADGATS